MNNKIIYLAFVFLLIFGSKCLAAEKIIYSSLIDGYWQIFVMNTDGNNKQQVTKSPVDKKYPIYLSDCGKILYKTSNNKFFLINSDGSENKEFLNNLGSITDPAYCDKSKKIVFSRFRQETVDNSDIWMVDEDGSNLTILTNDWGLQYSPGFSPDGKNLIFTSGHGYQTHEIYMLELDSKKTTRLSEDKSLDFLPVFSPDNKKIAYVSDESGDYEIWVMNKNGKGKTMLTEAKAMNTRPGWSPDGKEIVYCSTQTGSSQVWKMDKSGKNLTQLTFEGESQTPYWAGDFK